MDFNDLMNYLISQIGQGGSGGSAPPASPPAQHPNLPPPTMSGMPFQQPSHAMQGLTAPNQMLPTGGMMPYQNPQMQGIGIPYSGLQGTGMSGFSPSSNMGGFPQMYPYQNPFSQLQGYPSMTGNEMDRYRYGEQPSSILNQLYGY